MGRSLFGLLPFVGFAKSWFLEWRIARKSLAEPLWVIENSVWRASDSWLDVC